MHVHVYKLCKKHDRRKRPADRPGPVVPGLQDHYVGGGGPRAARRRGYLAAGQGGGAAIQVMTMVYDVDVSLHDVGPLSSMPSVWACILAAGQKLLASKAKSHVGVAVSSASVPLGLAARGEAVQASYWSIPGFWFGPSQAT